MRALSGGPRAAISFRPTVADAYAALSEEADIRRRRAHPADPGSDRETVRREPRLAQRASLTAGASRRHARRAISFGVPGLSGLLSPLRQLSFWKMKDRARTLGETAGSELLATLMQARARRPQRALPPDGPQLRLHRRLGHAGRPGRRRRACRGRSTRCVLVQGATSLWGFCARSRRRTSPATSEHRRAAAASRGPIVTTQSKLDTAVGASIRWPQASRGRARSPAAVPDIRRPRHVRHPGPGLSTHDLAIGRRRARLRLRAGQRSTTSSATGVIKDGGGASGAHSDIAKPRESRTPCGKR